MGWLGRLCDLYLSPPPHTHRSYQPLQDVNMLGGGGSYISNGETKSYISKTLDYVISVSCKPTYFHDFSSVNHPRSPLLPATQVLSAITGYKYTGGGGYHISNGETKSYVSKMLDYVISVSCKPNYFMILVL